ncbi:MULTISPECIES: hypothetical protein [Fischerella]|nr:MULTISPECIES: hypothetical protein [Fischerella]
MGKELVVGCWLLVVGCWLLVIQCSMPNAQALYRKQLAELDIK